MKRLPGSPPRPIYSTLMIAVAVVGLATNHSAMYVLHCSRDLNVKSAVLHVQGDTFSPVAVIAAAPGLPSPARPFLIPSSLSSSRSWSFVIEILVLVSSFSLFRDAFLILLQFAPRDIDTDEVKREIESVGGVYGVHNVHLWTLCSNINVLDAHG